MQKAPHFVRLLAAVFLLFAAIAHAAPTLVGTIDPAAGPDSNAPLKVYDPVTNRLFGVGVNSVDDSLAIFALDPATNQIVQSRSLGIVTFFHAPVLDSAGGRLFVLENNTNKRLHVLSTATLQTISVFNLDFSPEKLAVNPSTNKAYVISFNDYLTEVDLATGALRDVTSFSDTKSNIVLNPATNKLYVFDYNAQFFGVRIVSATTSSQYLASIPVSGFQSVNFVVSADGSKIYVLGTHDTGNINDPQGRYTGRILTIDATTNALVGQPIIVDKGINDFAYDPPGNMMYTTARYYIEPDVFHRASKTNLATGATTLLGELPIVNNAAGIAFAPSNQTVYLHVEGNGVPQMITINANTLARGGFNHAFLPWAVAVDSLRDRVYIKHNNNGEVTVADGTNRQVLAHVSLGGVSGPTSYAQTIAVNSSTARAYAPSFTEENLPAYKRDAGISVIDTLTNQVLTRILLASTPSTPIVPLGNVGVLADETNGKVYVTIIGYNPDTGLYGPRLLTIDGKRGSPTENQIIGTTDLRYDGSGMALNPVTKRLYVIHRTTQMDDISIYDTTKLGTNANASLGSFDSGNSEAVNLAINPVTNRLYIPDSMGLQVRVFNGANNAFITSINVNTTQNPYSFGLFAAAVDSTTNRIYIPDSAYTAGIPGTLNVIDGATNQITTLGLEIGALPYHLAVNEKTHTIYIAKERGTDVAVVNDAPPPVITTSAFPFKGGSLKVTGANGSYTFKVIGAGGVLTSTLPTGQTLSPSGVVSGIAEPGTYTITIRVTEDANPARFADRAFTFTVPGKTNPLTISVDQRDGSELKQGGIVKLQWTITNSSTTEKAPNVRFNIDPPPGFGLQDFGETPIFVDPVSGQATGAPVDPVTKKQVTIPGSKFNPLLRRTSFGYPAVTFGLGTMLPGQTLKVRANFRIAYDWPAGVDLPFSHAIASVGTKVGQYADEQMPGENITVAAADPGDTRPELTVDMTHVGAGTDLDNPSIVTVSRVGVAVKGAVPARTTNEILYRATYRNLGARTARSLQLRIPIPRNTKLKANSASVDGVKIRNPDIEKQFNVDGTLDQEVLIFPTLPDLEPYPAAGNSKTVSFIAHLKTVAEGDEITQNGVLLYTPELLRLSYIEKPLVAEVARPANMTASRPWSSGPLDFGPFADPNKPTLTSVQFRYQNAGGIPATGVVSDFTIPAGATYVDAFVLNSQGTVLGASERELATLRTQFPKLVSKYSRLVFDGTSQVHFNLGSVAPNTFGYVRVLLKADPATRSQAGAGSDPNRSLAKFTASDSKGRFLPAPGAPSAVRTLRPGELRDVAAATSSDETTGDLNLRHQSSDLGSVFVIISAPPFASTGDEVTYRITWGNTANTATQPGRMEIPIPAGTEYVENSMSNPELFANTAGPTDNVQIFNRDVDTQKATRISWSQNALEPHSLKTGTFKLKITAGPGAQVRLTQAQMVASNASSCYNVPHVLLVSESATPGLEDRRRLLAGTYGPGIAAAYGTSKRPNDPLLTRVGAITLSHLSVRIANAEFVNYPAQGVTLIPLGGLDRVVAIGGANLTAQGAFSGLSSGSGNHKLVAGTASTVRVNVDNTGAFATGASTVTNLLEFLRDGLVNIAPSPYCHNLVGNDGASLVGNDGSTLVGNDGSTLVGLNGATLVGLDGSTPLARFAFNGKTNFVQRLDGAGQLTGSPIELLRAGSQLFAAGRGDFLGTGGGKVLAIGPRGNLLGLIGTALVGQDGGTLVGQDGSTVIARDGASVIARDGAGLVGQDGSTAVPILKGQTLVGNDGSTVIARDGASLVGNDGSTVSFLGVGQDVGAGAGLVTDNGAGLVGNDGASFAP